MAFLKKKNKEEEKKPMSTLEEVRKAYENLSDEDKANFKQSVSDRVHESIAAQETDAGDKDSQTAEDREHEALGAEHADERKEEASEVSKTDEGHADAEEDGRQIEESIDRKLAPILERLAKLERSPREADKGAADKLSEIANRFEN